MGRFSADFNLALLDLRDGGEGQGGGGEEGEEEGDELGLHFRVLDVEGFFRMLGVKVVENWGGGGFFAC